jgi:peptidyl-prolyl cis-trans isomerase D
MLNNLRKAGHSLIGKIIATVLFGILILSFAIWGIGDIFRGAPPMVVARVGSTDITVDQFRTAFNNELQRLSRQFAGRLTTDQARALGLDQQVLSRLINEAVLNERARDLGLSVSDDLVARSIIDQPAFRDANGQFNRARFENVLRENGLTEAGFVREQRTAIARLHVAEALAGALPVPAAAREARHRFLSERRSADYFIVPSAAAGELPAPTPDELQAFYNDRKSSFRTPEYRALNIIVVNADVIAKPESVTDAEARQRYEQTKASHGSPERRTIQQIVFPSQEEAEAAFNAIKGGGTFEAVAAERGIPAQDLELGTFARTEMLDPAVAAAAFALEQGAVSGPVQGRFGIVLLRVTNVQPEAVRPFDEVAAELRRQIAQERARAELDKIHDAIEDMRASARPLPEIAREKGLALIQVPAVDQIGQDKSGSAVEALPEREALLRAAFASDIGVDNEALRTAGGGYVWFDVTGIEPSRDKTLEEVRGEVERQWRANEIAQKLAEMSRQFVERLDRGETLAAIAADAGAEPRTGTDLARQTAKDELTAAAVSRIFATPIGKAGTAPNGEGRVVFNVTAATVPPLLTTTQEAQGTEDQLRDSMADTLVAEYIAQAQKDVSIIVNSQALRQAIGGDI